MEPIAPIAPPAIDPSKPQPEGVLTSTLSNLVALARRVAEQRLNAQPDTPPAPGSQPHINVPILAQALRTLAQAVPATAPKAVLELAATLLQAVAGQPDGAVVHVPAAALVSVCAEID